MTRRGRGLPCSLRRWSPRSGSLRIYLHRSYRGWFQSELQTHGENTVSEPHTPHIHTLLTSTHSSTHSSHPHTCQQLQQVQHSSWFCLLKDRQAAEPQDRWRSSAASSSHINHDYNKLITLDISPSCFIWYFIDKKSDFCPGGKIQFNNRTHFFSFHISFIVQADTHTDIDQWSTTLSWSDRLICTSCTQHPSKHWEKRIMHKNSTNK